VSLVKDFYIFAIETSCDETSASIVKNGCEEISTVTFSQMDEHKKYGGVVPEMASRCHIEKITLVFEEVLQKGNMRLEDIDAIAVTYGPGLIGSLLIGVQAAKTISFIYDKPLIPVHHIAGHIYANRLASHFKFPLISLVVSGGHTELVYMNEEYHFEKIGGTLDDAVGEAYDKVARIMNLGYPGGPIVDQLAHQGKLTYNLPYPLDDDSYNFSFSGLKSAVINLVHNEKQRGNEIRNEDLAATFQDRVISVLVKKTVSAVKSYNAKQLLLAGGVAANKGLRDELLRVCGLENIELVFPPIQYCTDNAAMIGVAGYFVHQKGIEGDLSLNASATDLLH
jgi:N6-L-threonylcarbamoyladenine synthase